MSLFVDINKTFPDFELSIQLDCGHVAHALLGASGCGKSLTLKCIAGIEQPDSGVIVINGETVFDSVRRVNVPPQKRNVGYLFQSYALFPNMTVQNNISCVIKKQKHEGQQIVADIIKSFQLESVKDLFPKQISGGQQQRAALARILVSNPKLLMLDEPFSALDSHLKWSMEQEISAILADFGGTTLFVTHNRDEAYRLCSQIAVMNNGRIDTAGAKEAIFDTPSTLTAAKITGCKNISKAEKLGDFLIKATDWGITLNTKHVVSDRIRYVGVRSHHLEAVDSVYGNNHFLCHVRSVIEHPFERSIVFSFAESEEESTKLYLEMRRDKWDSKRREELVIYVPEDKILLLE